MILYNKPFIFPPVEWKDLCGPLYRIEERHCPKPISGSASRFSLRSSGALPGLAPGSPLTKIHDSLFLSGLFSGKGHHVAFQGILQVGEAIGELLSPQEARKVLHEAEVPSPVSAGAVLHLDHLRSLAKAVDLDGPCAEIGVQLPVGAVDAGAAVDLAGKGGQGHVDLQAPI